MNDVEQFCVMNISNKNFKIFLFLGFKIQSIERARRNMCSYFILLLLFKLFLPMAVKLTELFMILLPLSLQKKKILHENQIIWKMTSYLKANFDVWNFWNSFDIVINTNNSRKFSNECLCGPLRCFVQTFIFLTTIGWT